MSQGNMKSGLKATGIYPFNPLIIPDKAFSPSAATELPPLEPATDEQDIAEQMPPESTFANPTPGPSGSPRLPLSRHTQVTVTSTSRKRPSNPATSTYSDVMSPSADAPDSSDDGGHEMSQTPDSSAKSSTHRSFTELFPTPLRKKKTTCNMKPAINSHGLLLSKRLFQDIETSKQEKETKKNTNRRKRQATNENSNDFNRSRGKQRRDRQTDTNTCRELVLYCVRQGRGERHEALCSLWRTHP
ncbi:hypothetical protein PR048_025911 [Dryococelus australis]|uniref:Uncharacterized protein n=1 Tax=Dryococelus australis TaxID=614101 RepID=A0ABQ9GJX0_9NEOP|nr:hypothetical protein PR048_025911 [Dryococelus australis]